MDGVQLSQGYRATTKRVYFLRLSPQEVMELTWSISEDERLCQSLGHPVVLNAGPLDWESSALTTRRANRLIAEWGYKILHCTISFGSISLAHIYTESFYEVSCTKPLLLEIQLLSWLRQKKQSSESCFAKYLKMWLKFLFNKIL